MGQILEPKNIDPQALAVELAQKYGLAGVVLVFIPRVHDWDDVAMTRAGVAIPQNTSPRVADWFLLQAHSSISEIRARLGAIFRTKGHL